MVAFQVSTVDGQTAYDILMIALPELVGVREDFVSGRAGSVSILNSTTQEFREADVRVTDSLSPGVLLGWPYSTMHKASVQVGVNAWDLPGVVSDDYAPLAAAMLERVVLSGRFAEGYFTLWQEEYPPFLSWSDEGILIYQYGCEDRGSWNGAGFTHVALARLALPMIEGHGTKYKIIEADWPPAHQISPR